MQNDATDYLWIHTQVIKESKRQTANQGGSDSEREREAQDGGGACDGCNSMCNILFANVKDIQENTHNTKNIH